MLKKIIVALAATAALGLAHAQAGKFGYGASDDNSQGLAAKRFSELVKTAPAAASTSTPTAAASSAPTRRCSRRCRAACRN